MQEIDPNKALILKLTKAGDVIYPERQMELPAIASWPLGTQGSLVIANGETIQIPAGSVLDYSSIDIQLGGILEIVATVGAAISYIGCSGNITINGELRARSYLGNTETVTGLIKGENLSFTLTQSLGGNGGRSYISGYPSSIRPTSSGTNGFGGGGAGGGCVVSGIGATAGGSGGSGGGAGGSGSANSPAAGSAASGGGGNITLGNGGNGNIGNAGYTPSGIGLIAGAGGSGGGSGGGGGSAIWNNPPSPGPDETSRGAGGAGGGYKGKHGLPLYIYCLGSITGLGLVNLSGSNGFNGGQGANGQASYFGSGGGASGGGGAGGSGGYLWVRYGSTFSVPYSVNAGSGGSTGTNTVSGNGTTSSDSQTSGTAGVIGGINIQQIL